MIGIFKKRAFRKLRDNQKKLSFSGIKNAKNVLILFKNDTPNKTSLVLLLVKMLKIYQVKVDVFGFVNQKLKKIDSPVEGYYYKNNLNWKGLPNTEVVKDLTQNTFDVIIDLDQDIESPNNFILLSAKVGLKVGVCNKPDYDLVVEKANFNEEALVKEMEHFLVNITKN